jgi:hypothetical protein
VVNAPSDNYNLLIARLDQFIRKYYINRLIKGAIFTGIAILVAFLIISVPEYYLYFSTGIRAVLFYGFIALSLYCFTSYIAIPLFHYYKLGQIISHEQAAVIIGKHFTNVEDKLLNVLQLKQQSVSSSDNSLIEASIKQKSETLKVIPFTSAINLQLNRKYLRYLIAPAGVLLFIVFAAPNILKEGTMRLMKYNTAFEKPAPFEFNVLNKTLRAIQYDDFTFNVKMTGQSLPDEVFANIDGYPYKLTKKNASEFSYTFSKLQKDVNFDLSASGFSSKDYKINVLAKPVILNFTAALSYPAYLGRKNEEMKNTGDLVVPQGTKIDWTFLTQNTSNVSIRFKNAVYNATPSGAKFDFSKRMMEDNPYTIEVSGVQLPKADSVNYTITVIPDQFPSIEVSQMQDSTNRKYLYFAGDCSDDYGLTKLVLNYKIEHHDSVGSKPTESTIPVSFSAGKYSQFSYFWDLNKVTLRPGDDLSYYFEVWDNDGVNGNKSTRSTTMYYKMPTQQEYEKQQSQDNNQMKSDMQSSMHDLNDLQSDLQKVQENLLQKNDLNWEDKKQIQNLIDKQKDVEKKIEDLKKKFDKNLEQQKDYQKPDSNLLRKEDQLQKLMNNVMSDQMKDLMKKLQDLLDQYNKDHALDQLQKNQLNNDQLQKQMDQMLSLFKELEFEQQFKATENKLDSLAAQQDALKDKTENDKKADSKELEQQQQDINNQFKDIQNNMDSVQKLNKQLDDPNKIPDMGDQENQVKQDMQNSQEQLHENNKGKASKSQKSASDKMKKMSKQMADAMESIEMQQTEADEESVKQLLKNILKLSFDQEDLLDETKTVNIYNPKYVDIMKRQHDLSDNAKMVEDSVYALGKKAFEVQSFINGKITDINDNLVQSQSMLEDRQTPEASVSQQIVMKDFNDLALMFQESLQQMQQQMSKMSGGSMSCHNPGKGKPSMESLSKMQGQLNDKIQQLSQQMGKMPGGKEGGGQEVSEEIAKLAQEQAEIRQQLQQLSDELNQNGKSGNSELDKLQQQMDQTEKQLYDKQINDEMLKRQDDILKHLLQATNAERQQDTDNKRKAETATETTPATPPSLQDFLKKKQAQTDLYRTVPPDLAPFYKDMVEQYFKSISY